MAKTFSLEVISNNDDQPFESGAPERSLQRFANFLRSCSGGLNGGAVTMYARNDSVAASGTITLASCAAGTVIEINGVDFIAKSGAPTSGNNEFNIAGADSADATSLAAAINACTHASISGQLTASSSGAVVTVTATRKGLLGNGVTIKTKGILATALITAAGVDADDTITCNGVTLTGKQQRATGTLTAATAIAGDTFTIHEYTFTGVEGAATSGTLTFSVDTGDTECAASIAAQINAYTPLSGLVTATSATDTVTIRAVTAGTAGNSIALAGTVTTLEASDTTLSGGIAVANNEFEVIGTDTQVAADIARCINASSTAGINTFVNATSAAAVVTIRSKLEGLAGNNITIATSDGTDLAITGGATRLTGGTVASSEGAQASAVITCASVANADTVTINGVVFTAHTNTDAANQFAIDGSDTEDAEKLVRAINNSATALAKEVVATNSGAAVTITARKGGIAGNAITIATSNGTRLAITDSLARLAGGAAPTTVVPSGARLASGSETLSTFTF